MEELDIRDIAIIDAFPRYQVPRKILTVGCGKGRIEYHLSRFGFEILATDIVKHNGFEKRPGLVYRDLNIFSPDIDELYPIVICSEVLEHLEDYKTALENLLSFTRTRLIITVPVGRSFYCKGHVNFWDDRSVGEFHHLCKPFAVSISKIRTKPRDVAMGQHAYLIIVDMRQHYEG